MESHRLDSGSRRPEDTARVERLILAALDRGENLLLTYNFPIRQGPRPSVLRTRLRPEVESRLESARRTKGRVGHAVTIEGYARDARGRLEWLLLRCPSASRPWVEGYVHMHVDFFRIYAHEVARLTRDRPKVPD